VASERNKSAATPSHPLTSLWYAHIDGETFGPYTGHAIQGMAKKDQVTGEDLVCPEGGSTWVQAKDDPILRLIFVPTARKARGRGKVIVVGAVVLLIFGWMVWPYYTLYSFSNAIQLGETFNLESLVDWDSVRQGLRGDFNALFAKHMAQSKGKGSDLGAGLAVVLGPAIINQVIDNYVTPQGITNLIRTGKPANIGADQKVDNATPPPDGKDAANDRSQNLPDKNSKTTLAAKQKLGLDRVIYAFFLGSPFTFKVDLKTDPDPEPKIISLIFRWSGNWKLTRVLVPLDDALPETKQPAEAAATPANALPVMEAPSPSVAPPAPVEPARLKINLMSKTFKPANPSASDYQAELRFSISIANQDAKDIRAFDGVLTFTDLLGNNIFSSKIAINDPIGAGRSIVWNGGVKYNQFMDDHQRLRNESQDNLKIKFVSRKILYSDGTSIEAAR
jgi:DUF2939 family protein/uncharacterized protein DUF4339